MISKERVSRVFLALAMLTYDAAWLLTLHYLIMPFYVMPLVWWWTRSSIFYSQLLGAIFFFTAGLSGAVYFFAWALFLILDR
jgi:hypothetical protein